MREREVIRRFFNFAADASVLTGIGDDAAVLRPPPGLSLVVSTDSLNEGVHFFADASPFLLARKSAAVSLSDMAAMGARPLWLFTALSTAHDVAWIEHFAEGLASSAADFAYTLAGGDLCRADLTTITTTAIGAVKNPLLRSGAKVGEQVWISGALGEAALAVYARKNGLSLSAETVVQIEKRLHDPIPRLDLDLHGIASAVMDLSDGLVIAAKTIAEQSHCGMILHANNMPVPPPLSHLSDNALQLQLMLCGGDDYELIFCAPPQKEKTIQSLGAICIGEVTSGGGVKVLNATGWQDGRLGGYAHEFAQAFGHDDNVRQQDKGGRGHDE